MLRRDPSAAAAARRAPAPRSTVELPAEAESLFERLRAWRAAAAKEQGVPAYVVFHDATLRQIATDAPATLAALSRINGVGENKLAKYGDQILEVIAAELDDARRCAASSVPACGFDEAARGVTGRD